MPESRAFRIPPLSETHHSRESLLDALRSEVALPSVEVAFATLYAEEIEPDILALLDRACVEDLDYPSGRLLFRGLHILGGRQFARGCPALIKFLRGPPSRVDDLLGDAVTETLTRIIAGMFDGKVEPLLALVTDLDVDEFVRDAAMGAVAFLAFSEQVDRTAATEFLARFDLERTAPPGDATWHSWMAAVALLGLGEFSERVHLAFEDGRIAADIADVEDFRKLLADARERPDDATRFEEENWGYIDDVVVALERFVHGDDDGSEFAEDDSSHWSPPNDHLPVRNPWRGVGRNDPCPCGSGKKFKKCCLPSIS
jgi:uncharacterized protein